MEGNFVVEAVCSSLNVSVEEAQQLLFDSDGQGISRLKVVELKDIIKDLKAQAYSKVHLSVYANKPALVDMLRAVAAAERINNAPPQLPPAALATPQMAAPPAHGALPQPRLLVPQAAAHAASRAAHQPQPVLVTGPFSPPPQIHHGAHHTHTNNSSAHNAHVHTPALPAPTTATKSKSKNKSKHKAQTASSHPGHTYIAKLGDAPNLQARLLSVLTSGHKIQAYKILKEVPGVTEEEILAELEGHSNVESLDVDDLMFSIVMKRESNTPGKPRLSLGAEEEGGEGEDEEYDALLEQENRDMDMAIRESEKERDVIQQRKRARTEALRQGQDGYLTSGEYQASVLLFGCPGLCSGDDGGGNEGEQDVGTAASGGSGGSSGTKSANGSISGGGGGGGGGGSGNAYRNVLSNQVLSAAALPAAALHRSLTNTITHTNNTHNTTNNANNTNNTNITTHSQNSKSSTSSYSYSSTGAGYNSSSSAGSSSSNKNTSNVHKNGSSGSSKGSNSSVVDLTLDSESESELIVRKVSAGSSSSSGSNNRTLTNGSSSSSGAHDHASIRTPLSSSTTNAEVHGSHDRTPTTTTAALCNKPNMSRSQVVYTFCKLLDELHNLHSSSNTVGSGASSGTSSSTGVGGSSANTTQASASSGSGVQTKPFNLLHRVYDIAHIQHCNPHCITLLTALRTTLSRLLLLESNATKFYKNTSTACMVYIARRIDGKLLCDTAEQAINSNVNTGSTTTPTTNTTLYPDDCIYHLHRHYLRHTSLVNLLAHESDKLEKGMYRLQSDGSLVPYIFKKPRLAYYARVLAASIDTDGMEVVDIGSGSGGSSGSSGSNGSSGSSGSGGGSNGGAGSTSTIGNVVDGTAIHTTEPVDSCMWLSSEESCASEYNSDEDDF